MKKRTILFGLGIVGLAAAYSWGLFTLFTSHWPGGNDFYVVWRGVRALLVDGNNPYGEAVARIIQQEMLGRLAGPDEHQFAFAYPLGIAFFVGPLVWLPFPLARAIWMVALQAAVVGLLACTLWPRRPRPIHALALLLATVLFYPTARGLILGQPALVIAGAIALGLWAIRARRDGMAGVAVAVTLLKPQMVVLFVPVALLWTAWQRRWRFWLGLFAGSAVLLLVPALVFPRWPLEFVAGLRAYADYTSIGSPLTIAGTLHGPDAAQLLQVAGLSAAVAWLGWRLYAAGHRPDEAGSRAEPLLLWSLVLTMWIAWRTATPNQLVGLLPVLGWWRDGLSTAWLWLWLSALLVVPWAVFLVTLVGETEHPAAYLPIPILSLLALVAGEWSR